MLNYIKNVLYLLHGICCLNILPSKPLEDDIFLVALFIENIVFLNVCCVMIL